MDFPRGGGELVGDGRRLVDVDAEGAVHDLLGALGDHVLDLRRELALPDVKGAR